MQTRRYAAAIATAVAVVVGSGNLAFADPPDPVVPSQDRVEAAKQAVDRAARQQRAAETRLQAAQDKLDAVNDAAAAASEKYNESRAVLAQRVAAAKRASAQAALAEQSATSAQSDLDQVAASVYMQGGSLGGLEALVGTLGSGDFARNAADVESVGGFRQRTLADARAAATRARTARRAAAAAQLQQVAAAARAQQDFTAAKSTADKAATETAALDAQRAVLVIELARLRRTSAAVEQARLDGLAQQAATRAANARLAASSSAIGLSTGPLPAADTDAAAAAIDFAKKQLGKPYVWAAEGPDSYDCSGLTMKAWQAGGAQLAHFTGWQWQQSARVPISQLKPGDLVFFGASVPTIHHVGLYVGNGQMIEAPRTGLNVRYSSIYRSSLLPYGGRPS